MSNFSDFIGGSSGGSSIGEFKIFGERGETFTDTNGFLWLKTGVISTDLTTYPDAPTDGVWYNPTNYTRTTNTGNFSPDNGYALKNGGYLDGYVIAARQSTTSQGYTAYNFNGYIETGNMPTSNSSSRYSGFNYVKCSASSGVNSNVAGAGNMFTIAIEGYTSWSYVRLSTYTNSADANANGKPVGLADSCVLNDESGSSIHVSIAYQIGNVHFDNPNRKLYVCHGNHFNMSLYVYDFSSETAFGVTSHLISATSKNASGPALNYAPDNCTMVRSVTFSSTHMYVAYYADDAQLFIRSIPLSGNLSWASGTDLSNFVTDEGWYQNSDGDILKSGTNYDTPYTVFYGMDGNTPTFLKTDNSNNLNQYRAQPLIGVGTSSVIGVYQGTGTKYYMRIK
mgnify:CR=1 FL=1